MIIDTRIYACDTRSERNLPMDVQVLLVISLSVLVICIVAVSMYLVIILKEFKQTLQKINGVLESTDNIKNLFVNPIATISNIVATISETIKTVRSIRTIADETKDFKKKKED